MIEHGVESLGRRGVGLRIGACAVLLLVQGACGPSVGEQQAIAAARAGHEPTEWLDYGGDRGAQHYSALREITPANVRHLEVAWMYQHGDVSDGEGAVPSTTAFEATPTFVDGTLYCPTPFNRLIALDPESGRERWAYDAKIDLQGNYANQLICRGVSHWRDAAAQPDAPGAARVFMATNDARLVALDARTGQPCPDFGEAGIVDLKRGVGDQEWSGEYQVTSPPAIAGDVVIVGSAVCDNQRITAPSGVVRGYDARTGALLWGWDLAPEDLPESFERIEWSGYALGTPNVWAPLAVDEARDLVFVGTGNPSPDYYRGGGREALDKYGSSVVALRGSTGEVVWHFQTVHHDLWDFDVPAQPTLTHVMRNGERIPVVIQATKMGLLFVLHRETGEPIFGVEERPVPQGGAPGQELSPTQPFPIKPPPLVRFDFPTEDAWGLTPWDRKNCYEKVVALRFDGIYTPPTQQGSLMFPGNAGGSNWGGVAVDPERQLCIANVMNLAWAVTLLDPEAYQQSLEAHPHVEHGPQRGTAFGMRRQMLMSQFGLPCTPPPWGELVAVDLNTGDIRWTTRLGTVRDIAPVPIPIKYGTPNLGGPLVTASGLIFIGAAMDDYLRAFDRETGEELWKGRLPAGGQATPMTYVATAGGRQYVVIAAGGHGRAGTTLGDYLVAFALPAVTI